MADATPIILCDWCSSKRATQKRTDDNGKKLDLCNQCASLFDAMNKK